MADHSTAEDSVCQSNTTTKLTSFRLLDLPPELRERIYKHALVPLRSIELAPLCVWDNKTGAELGYNYHWHRYTAEILPSMDLLRVSKFVNNEATPTLYWQPFRSSNETSWLVLGHWLERIGPRLRGMVRHITVGHPGQARIFPNLACHPDDSMRLLRGWERSFLHNLDPPRTINKIYAKETLDSLAAMPRLRRLRLAIVAIEGKIDYEDLMVQPVLAKSWISADSNLEVSVLSLSSPYPFKCHFTSPDIPYRPIRQPPTLSDEKDLFQKLMNRFGSRNYQEVMAYYDYIT